MSVPITELAPALSFDLFYIAMSDRCNLSCIMCSTTKHPGEYAEGMDNIDLPLEQWKEVIGNIMRFSTKCVCFGGGEPLLRQRELGELVPMVASKGVNVNIVTNSTLLTEDFLGTIGQYKDRVIFVLSIDGLEEETDRIRGKGVFEKIMRATELLKLGKWKFLFTSVLMPQNFYRFEAFLKFIHKEFPEIMIDIQPVIPHNELYYVREKFILQEEQLDALKNLLTFLHEEAWPQTTGTGLREEAFLNIVGNARQLYGDLIKNGYINTDGVILDKFQHARDVSEMALDFSYDGSINQVYSLMRTVLKNQKKLKITRPFSLLDLYWNYFTNTLRTNNQCKMGTRSFNINRRGNLWICGRELEYPLYEYKIEKVLNTPEYYHEMKRVEACTSPCFAGLVI